MKNLLEGKKVVAVMKEKHQAAVSRLKAKGINPTLGIIRLGERAEDISYEKGAVKRCESVGVEVKVMTLPSEASQEELLGLIKHVNRDSSIHGVLLFRPLPTHIDEDIVRNALVVEKDIDGIGDSSLIGVFAGVEKGFSPCTASACLEILDFYGYSLKGKKVVVIGRSLVIGKPVAMMMMSKHATITICHSGTQDIPSICRTADIIVAAAGKAKLVGKECFSPGQVVLDVGINFDESGKMCGDVDFAAAESIVEAITPVPGGIGTVTTSVMVGNVIAAAENVLKTSEVKGNA